jgi:DNA-binding transcriptional regulator YdaS (Cro superfamily)
MDELKKYLATLPVAEQEAYATKCGTTINYLRKAISKGSIKFDGALCRLLDENSGGAVSRESLRPDIWPKEDRRAKADRRANRRGAGN